jgi:putative drug exporter of the RND superfamily
MCSRKLGVESFREHKRANHPDVLAETRREARVQAQSNRHNQRKSHPMSSALYRLGRFAARRPWTVIGAWLLVSVVVVVAANTVGRDFKDSAEVPGLDSQRAVELLSAVESDQAGLTARVVMTPLDADATFFDAADAADAADALADVERAVAALPKVVAVTEATTALASGSDAAIEQGVISPDGRVALISIQYPVQDDLDRSDLDRLEEAVAEARVGSPLQIEIGGDLYFAFGEPETGAGEMLGLIAAIVILLIAFGSLIATGLPIGMAVFGLALGVSSMGLVAYLIDIPSWVPQFASMIGLGVGIDYALFLVTRHRELLHRGMTVSEAAGRAVATAGQAVVFAGGTVVIAILGLAVAGVPFVTAAGVAIAVIVLIMVAASVTLLPAFLGLAGHSIDRFGIHRRHRTGSVGAGWERWGRHVSRHAWPYAIGVTVLMVALAAPVLSLRLGFPDDGTQPESMTQRRAYDLVADGFGSGINGPLVVAVDLVGDDRGDGVSDVSVVEPLAAAIAADPGVAGVAPPEIDASVGVATIVAFPTTSPQDDATFATVERLRYEVFPSVLSDSSATAHVGGATANFGDVGERVRARLPAFIGLVVLLSFVLLMIVFRSILVPLKAAVMNLLSIGAAYGVLVMVFQWGWGKELIGLETTVPIVSFVPLFMFAILFGLSMDYEVFLLSRVREEYVATGDNEQSVIHGLASTARVITSAALIMICVFGAFVFGNDPTTKMFGLGLATAILIDATIVRVVLVPATMKLMGNANWWLPGWLDRILPTIDIDSEPAVHTSPTAWVTTAVAESDEAEFERVGS